MPIRKRADKRRSAEGLDEWFFVFTGGHDYFRQLPPLGIKTNRYNQPSLDDSHAAWLRLGYAFLQLPRDPDQGEPWALREFGEPGRRRSR